MATQVSGVKNWLSINNQLLRFDSKSENQHLGIKEYSRNIIRMTPEAPDTLSVFIGTEQLETARHGIWDWNPKHYAGLYQITVEAPDQAPQTAWIRVFPHKFLQRYYQKMQSELSLTAIDLLFHLDSPAIERVRYIPNLQDTSALHDYKQICLIIEKMRDIMLCIRREPYGTLHSYSVQQNIQEITRFSREIAPIPGEGVRLPATIASNNHRNVLPQQWSAQRYSLNYDNHENRLLKHFLQKQLIVKLNSVQERAEKEKKKVQDTYTRYHNPEDSQLIDKLNDVIEECGKMKVRCIHWSSELFLQTVQSVALTTSATQVLQKNPYYSRFYQLYLQFQQRLQTTIETEKYITELAMRKVSSLYEMWSLFGITKFIVEELLKSGYTMTANATFEVDKDYFHFDIRKNIASIVLAKDTMRIEIKYEPIYPNQSLQRNASALVATTMGSNPLMPDMALEAYQEGEPKAVLIFDAKYRWQAFNSQLFPNPEDIDKMYRYLSNIQYEHYQPGSRFSYKTTSIIASAYIIYPGRKIHTEADNKIGALPFFPNISNQSINDVREQLKELLSHAHIID